LDFCTASNVHKNILNGDAVQRSKAALDSEYGAGRQNCRNPGAASYTGTPLTGGPEVGHFAWSQNAN